VHSPITESGLWWQKAKFAIIFLMKLAMICSSGGHLLLLHVLKDFWSQYDRFWVTFKKEDAISLLEKEKIYWAFFPTNRNLFNLFRNFFVALKVLFKEKPDVIISSGAGVAIPFFYLGKLLRKKLVFIEAYERIENPSLTGRLVYPLTDVFILHWEEQKKSFPKGIVLGELL
jgi:beta-1,4-N-acetylglucosaminyltransferase